MSQDIFMKEIADLLNEMCQRGIIKTYAIFGAVAQMRYTEAVVTMDLDVLAAIQKTDSLILSLLEAKAVTEEEIGDIAMKHNLAKEWKQFKEKFLDEN
jgi:predicted nucleotidyltransferase